MLSIPAVESARILIHGVLAHELGHALYNKREIAKDLLPKIRIKEDLVRGLTKAMFENQQKQGNATPELQLRKQVTQEISARVNGWVKELCCDAIGIRLRGPALFFAEAHLLTSFRPIDKSSATHPAPRLRVRLMIRMLKQLYRLENGAQSCRSSVEPGTTFPQDRSPGPTPMTNLTDAIDDVALDLISDASTVATSSLNCYSRERFSADVEELGLLFLNLIPPGEVRDKPVTIAAILNAGWHVYLCDFEAFRESLHAGDRDTRFAAAAKLHELVLKALEISEIRTTWEEAKRDSQRGKN